MANGSKTLGQRVKEKAQSIIKTHQPEKLPEDILSQIKIILDRADAK